MHKPEQKPEGPLFEDVYPPAPVCIPAVPDGRTQALLLLRRYLSNLRFYRVGSNNTAKPLCIPEDNIKLQSPDYEEELTLPAIGMVAGQGTYHPNNLTPILVEESKDKFCEGHVVHVHDEYEEDVTLEVWTATREELRAITGGIETAFQPAQGYTGLRFVMRTYYNGTVLFTLVSKQIMDDADANLKRRRAMMVVNMRFNVLSLEPYRILQPTIQVDTQ